MTSPQLLAVKKIKREQFNLLLREILNDDALIQQWDAVFSSRFINNLAFEKLLLAGFISKKSVWRAAPYQVKVKCRVLLL